MIELRMPGRQTRNRINPVTELSDPLTYFVPENLPTEEHHWRR
jgi:hypothetical protein